MKQRPVEMPTAGMNRHRPPDSMGPFWRTLINLDVLHGKWNRRKGSTLLHEDNADGIPQNATIWDFFEGNEQELSQDRMLLLLEDSGGATELWSKERPGGGSYGNFTQITWQGILAAWTDANLGTAFPYPRIIRVPRSWRIAPGKIDSSVQLLYFREYPADYQLFANSIEPKTMPNSQRLLEEATLLEPVDMGNRILVAFSVDDGTMGTLAKGNKYRYCYTLVYDDGQESLPWYHSRRSRIPEDLIYADNVVLEFTSGVKHGAARILVTLTDDPQGSVPTQRSWRIIGINVWRSREDVEDVIGDFYLLGFVSFDETDAENNYYETDHDVTGANPTGAAGKTTITMDQKVVGESDARWEGNNTATQDIGPTYACFKVTEVAGNPSHALVGNLYLITDRNMGTNYEIEVDDPDNDLGAQSDVDGVIVEGVAGYDSVGGYYHAMLFDHLDDISASPELWSSIAVLPGEYTIRATGKVAKFAYDRLFLFNCYIDGEHRPADAVVSPPYRYDTFGAANRKTFAWDGGESIVTAEFTGTGLLIFKERSVGDYLVHADGLDFVTSEREIFTDDGICGEEAELAAGGAVFFAGWQGIYRFTEGEGFTMISNGPRDQQGAQVGGIQEIYDLMDDDDKALISVGWNPESRKVLFTCPIINGTVTWDDIMDPTPASGLLDGNYVTFEWNPYRPGWSLSDLNARKFRRGVDGELFTCPTGYDQIDQQNAAFGSEQETNILGVAETPWWAGDVVRLIAAQLTWYDGPVTVSLYGGDGMIIGSSDFSDTQGAREVLSHRFGGGGNPVYIVIESRFKHEVHRLAVKLKGLPEVEDR